MINKLSILIPAYNEGGTIHLILDKIKAVTLDNGIQKEIIIVNDCSTDDTVAKIEAYIEANNQLAITLLDQWAKI
jgi:glycosyltransferase involved in cell wall biosynthesis